MVNPFQGKTKYNQNLNKNRKTNMESDLNRQDLIKIIAGRSERIIDLRGVNYENVDFSNLGTDNIDFSNSTFSNCTFKNKIDKSTLFSTFNLSEINIHGTHVLGGADINGGKVGMSISNGKDGYFTFRGITPLIHEMIVFQSSELKDIRFYNTDLKSSWLEEGISTVEVRWTNMGDLFFEGSNVDFRGHNSKFHRICLRKCNVIFFEIENCEIESIFQADDTDTSKINLKNCKCSKEVIKQLDLLKIKHQGTTML